MTKQKLVLSRIRNFAQLWFQLIRRQSEHTDRNIELKPTVLFRTTPTHLEIIITWCYRKPFHIVLSPCKDSNPTYMT